MSTLNTQLLCRRSINFPELAIFAYQPGAMINLHWLKLHVARTIFHGPKGVHAIKVRLYYYCCYYYHYYYYYRFCLFLKNNFMTN